MFIILTNNDNIKIVKFIEKKIIINKMNQKYLN
jgi:hypothetical protein